MKFLANSEKKLGASSHFYQKETLVQDLREKIVFDFINIIFINAFTK